MAEESPWKVGLYTNGLSFTGGRKGALEGRVRARPAQTPVCAVGRSSCAQEPEERRLASCSKYNPGFRPSSSLAETAACASDMVSCSCFSRFSSRQLSICPPQTLASPRWLGKAVCHSETRQRVQGKEFEMSGALANKSLLTHEKTQDQGRQATQPYGKAQS